MSILRSQGRRSRYKPGFDLLDRRRLLAVTYTVYPLAAAANPNSIVVGPDGNLWFAVPYSNGIGLGPDGSSVSPQAAAIGVINPSTGATREYSTPNPTGSPDSIVSGPGGQLWFFDSGNIASIDPTTHAIREYPITIPGNDSVGLAVGSDGNLWFPDAHDSSVARFDTTTHLFTAFPMPDTSDQPLSIASGPDGNIWFGAYLQNTSSYAVDDISLLTHVITLTPLPTPAYDPVSLTAGPDGNVWFNEVEGSISSGFFTKIASIIVSSHVISEYSGGDTGGITVGPDGNLWYDGLSGLGEFNPTTHVATIYAPPVSSGYSNLTGKPTIVTGPDDNLWFVGMAAVASASIIPANQAAISGSVELDPTGTDPSTPLPNQTVFLDLKGDGSLDPGDPTATTDSHGTYTFTGLTPGTYTVRVASYAGTVATSPAGGARTVTVAGGQLGSPDPLGILPTSSLMPLSFNPTPFGAANPDVQTAEVDGLYRLILGRAPDAAGGAAAVSYLKGGGALTQLAADLLGSAEYDTDAVDALYRSYLRRAPDAAGGAAAVAYLQGGGSLDGLAESLMDSAEYSALFAADATFVQAIYGDILGRLASTAEVAAGAALLGTGYSRSSYVAFLVNSPESDTRIVVGAYGVVFARAADAAGQSAAVAALQGGEAPVSLAASLLGSAEFIARADATVG